MQVAPGFGVGLTASLITGGNDNTIEQHFSDFSCRLSGHSVPFHWITNTHLTSSYVGYDFRIGFLYKVNEMVSTGLRVELPRYIAFSQTEIVTDSH